MSRRVDFLLSLEFPDHVTTDDRCERWLISALKHELGRVTHEGPTDAAVRIHRIARATALQRLERAPGANPTSGVADAANAASLAQEKDLT